MSHLNYLEKLLDGVDVEWLPMKSLCSTITTGKLNANAMEDDGIYPFYTCNENPYKINSYAFDLEAIIISGNGSQVGHLNYYKGRFNAYQRTYVVGGFEEKIIVMYLFHYLNYTLKSYITQNSRKGSVPYITMPMLENFQVPIPCPNNPEKSLAIQAEIVRILDAFTAMTAELTAELNLRKKQYNYYRDQLLSFEEGEVEWKMLGEVAVIGTGSHDTQDAIANGKYIFYARGREPLKLNEYDFDETAIITAGDGAGVGKVFHYAQGKYALHQRAYRIVPSQLMDPRFVYHYLASCFYEYIQKASVSSSVTSLRRPMFLNLPIPVPSLKEQARIVAILDKFDTLTTSIQEGLPREIELRQKQYEYYRDLLLNFPKPMEETA